MEIIKTDAIPLWSIKHSESSRIVRFFTESGGKLSALAKGARKSRRAVPTDTFSLVNIIYRFKPSREIQILTGVELLDSFLSIRDDFRKCAAAFAVCELTDKTTEVSDPNPALFKAMTEALSGLNRAKTNPVNHLWLFQLRLIEALGFGLNLDNCLECGKSLHRHSGERSSFSFEGGGVLCGGCRGVNPAGLSPESLKVLLYLREKGVKTLERLKPSKGAGREIERALQGFLHYHIEGLKRIKSLELLGL